MNKQAIVIGGTGLVGRQLVKELSSLYQRVVVIARRQPKSMSANMHFYQLHDFATLPQVFDNISQQLDFDEMTDAFSCLGTTKKIAGGEDGFRIVDFDYNLSFATYCRDNGIHNFFLLSAMGADTDSRFFYNRVKGELEKAIIALNFHHCSIFRPSLLLGKHKGRPLESLSQKALGLISPMLPKRLPAHPIAANRVAMAMAMTAQQLYESRRYRQQTDSTPSLMIIDNQTMLKMTHVRHSQT